MYRCLSLAKLILKLTPEGGWMHPVNPLWTDNTITGGFPSNAELWYFLLLAWSSSTSWINIRIADNLTGQDTHMTTITSAKSDHWWPMDSPGKRPVTLKCSLVMTMCLWYRISVYLWKTDAITWGNKNYCLIKNLWDSPVAYRCRFAKSLQWRHNERNDVSNNRHLDCSLNRLFRNRSKTISKPHVQLMTFRSNLNFD